MSSASQAWFYIDVSDGGDGDVSVQLFSSRRGRRGLHYRAIRCSLTITRSNSHWVKTIRPFTGFSSRAVVANSLFFESQCQSVVQPLTAQIVR